jgi:hypothetical protein
MDTNVAHLDRAVAEVLVRAHIAEQGPTASNPILTTPISSKAIQEQLQQSGRDVGHFTVVGILEDFAAQDFIALSTATGQGGLDAERQVTKVYPARLKRQFNLWHLAEE